MTPLSYVVQDESIGKNYCHQDGCYKNYWKHFFFTMERRENQTVLNGNNLFCITSVSSCSKRNSQNSLLYFPFGGLLYGYDIGATSSATISIQSPIPVVLRGTVCLQCKSDLSQAAHYTVH